LVALLGLLADKQGREFCGWYHHIGIAAPKAQAERVGLPFFGSHCRVALLQSEVCQSAIAEGTAAIAAIEGSAAIAAIPGKG
jgi:hypothetical protein